VRKIYYKIT